MADTLIRITAPHFVAGCVARDGRVVEAAPILRRHLLGADGPTFAVICRRNGWLWEVVRPI